MAAHQMKPIDPQRDLSLHYAQRDFHLQSIEEKKKERLVKCDRLTEEKGKHEAMHLHERRDSW